MTTPFISIIIDSYNYGRFVAQAIDSALSQTYPHIEVIVVDDGSVDDSAEIINSFGENVQKLFKTNGGQASALNAGFAACKGDLVLFLDSDDSLESECIERAVDAWLPEFSKLHFPLRIIDTLGKPSGRLKPPVSLLPNDALEAVKHAGSYIYPPTSGNLFARTYLERVMPMPEPDWRTHPDAYLCSLAPLFGKVGVVREPLGSYRVHGDNHHILVGERGIKVAMLHDDIKRCVRIGDIVTSFCLKQSVILAVPAFQGYPQLKARLVSKKLTGNKHPIDQDSILKLALLAIARVWQDLEPPLYKKIVFSLWVLAVSFTPKILVKPMIDLAYSSA